MKKPPAFMSVPAARIRKSADQALPDSTGIPAAHEQMKNGHRASGSKWKYGKMEIREDGNTGRWKYGKMEIEKKENNRTEKWNAMYEKCSAGSPA